MKKKHNSNLIHKICYSCFILVFCVFVYKLWIYTSYIGKANELMQLQDDLINFQKLKILQQEEVLKKQNRQNFAFNF